MSQESGDGYAPLGSKLRLHRGEEEEVRHFSCWLTYLSLLLDAVAGGGVEQRRTAWRIGGGRTKRQGHGNGDSSLSLYI